MRLGVSGSQRISYRSNLSTINALDLKLDIGPNLVLFTESQFKVKNIGDSIFQIDDFTIFFIKPCMAL